jgi:long-chain acyl-CoA synthetase
MKAITQFLENSYQNFGSRTALQIKEGSQYFKRTYQELFLSSQKIARFLKSIGVQKSDRVGLITENTPYWGLAFFGILWTEATAVPIDSKLKEHSIAKILEHAECRVIFSSAKFLDMIETIVQSQKFQPLIVLLDEDTPEKPYTLKRILNQNVPAQTALAHPDPETLAIILYTSGTTGSPKGVMLTHANISSNVEKVSPLYPFTHTDHFVSLLPLCHTYAITCDFLIPIEAGAAITYVENLKGSVLVERMQENQATVLIAVPALIQMMYNQMMLKIDALPVMRKKLFHAMKALSGFFLKLGLPIGHILFKSLKNKLSPFLRFFISGGAPIDPRIIEEYFKLGIPIYQGYGLTETSPILTVNTPKANRIGSVGKTIPEVEIRIENQEIVARGPNVMRGYYKNEEATLEVLKQGWFYTGDIGHFDQDGYLYITGRLKNIIVTRGGKNVSPEEVEEELCRSTWIKEACVVGVMKETRGFKGDEQVYALIVPNIEAFKAAGVEEKDKKRIEEQIYQELKAANERLADYKRIRGFEIWDELPKTTTLKIKRKDALKMLKDRGYQPINKTQFFRPS